MKVAVNAAELFDDIEDSNFWNSDGTAVTITVDASYDRDIDFATTLSYDALRPLSSLLPPPDTNNDIGHTIAELWTRDTST